MTAWERADLDRADPPREDTPAWVWPTIFRTRERNRSGQCWREGCARPLADQTACIEHAHRATEEQQLEVRAGSLGLLTRPRTRRYW